MEEALIKRILPHSIEAEQSVIGAMLMDQEAIIKASEIISGDDFYQHQYGIVFDAIVELYNEGKPVDLVTLQNRLKEKELPPDISSMEYVRDLISAVPTSANVKYYAKIVSEKAVLRRLIKANEEIANTCYLEKENTEIILEEAEKKLFNILQRRNNEEYVPIQQVVLNAINNIEKASKLKGSVTGIPTGFMDLDYKTSGMHPSDLVLIAARPSMGKTAFVLNIAQHVAFRQNLAVAIFSLEMSKEQLVNRLFSLESRVDAQALRTGNLSDSDWEKLIEGAGTIGNSKLIIDDTPEAVILSGFDPIRREVARIALEKLIVDGRIHPARIEEVVTKVKKQVEDEVVETGKRTVIDLGVHGLHPELIRMIGKMKYRSSYGQNLLQHARETANLCAVMASELGLNPKKAKRAGLLHDIGKVPDDEPELPHAILGMKLCEKYKEKPDICNAVGAHHDEVEMQTLLAPIVQVCDAISGARPGARREIVEAYIKRLNDLEQLALSYPGVVKTYAIQAGRELRVIVGADKIDDKDTENLSAEIAKKIQDEMTYPGQVKITVIRETRAVSYAK